MYLSTALSMPTDLLEWSRLGFLDHGLGRQLHAKPSTCAPSNKDVWSAHIKYLAQGY